MNRLLRLLGGFLVVLTAVTVSAGCSLWLREISTREEPVPLTNRIIAETVIRCAFDSLDIPGGNGAAVRWYLDEASSVYEFAAIIAPEFLLSKGFRSTEESGSIPEIRFSVDTLFVSLNTVRSNGAGKRIARYAEARISATVACVDGTRKVYTGQGRFEDSFPASMMEIIGKNEPFVTSSDRLITRAKPFVFGAALTFFLWYLYSFRG